MLEAPPPLAPPPLTDVRWADIGATAVRASRAGVDLLIPTDPANSVYAEAVLAGIAPVSLPDARAERQAQVFAARDARLADPLAVVTVGGVAYRADAEAQRLVQGAMLMALAVPGFSQVWKVADGSVVTLDGPAITALAAALGGRVAGLYAVEQAKTAALMGAGTLAEVLAVDPESGWPNPEDNHAV
jgi:hypothetical protein